MGEVGDNHKVFEQLSTLKNKKIKIKMNLLEKYKKK